MERIKNISQCLFPKEGYEPSHEDLEFQLKQSIGSSGAPYNHIKSVPYDQIGQWYAKGSNSEPRDSGRIFYPDWYKITPAYSIQYAGMSAKDHITSFFNPRSRNNVAQRALRWIQEPQMVVYCDNAYKLSTLFNVFVLLMTFLIAVWQIRVNAQTRYTIPELENKTNLNAEEQERLDGLNKLNEITVHPLWRYGIPLLTFLAGMISAWNVYKRTTRPQSGTEITDLVKGSANWNHRSERNDQTISRVATMKRVSVYPKKT